MPVETGIIRMETVTGARIYKVEFVAVKFERCRFVESTTLRGRALPGPPGNDFPTVYSAGVIGKIRISLMQGNGKRAGLTAPSLRQACRIQLNMVNFRQSLLGELLCSVVQFREAFFGIKLKKTGFANVIHKGRFSEPGSRD